MKRSIMFVFGLFLVLSCLLAYDDAISRSWQETAGSHWLTGWAYRKVHNITGSLVGAQTNYQMMVNIHYDNGFDYAGDVYLSGKCRPDFGDVRFTDVAGNSLDYWIQEKTDGAQALFWVEVNYVPAGPDCVVIFVYYGNPTATTTSNKDWVFPLCSDFEDGTKQGWTISWNTYVEIDGTSSPGYRGAYCRYATRIYGSSSAGIGDFYEYFLNFAYLTSGSYYLDGVAKFYHDDSYRIPKDVHLKAGGISISTVTNPGDQWHRLKGNFTLATSGFVEFQMEFHIYISSGLLNGGSGYFIDNVFLRKWCDPEPAHGEWGKEWMSDDDIPPRIGSVEYTPTCPSPYVCSNFTRANEPTLITANVTEPLDESGIAKITLSYRADGEQWFNTTMTPNSTTQLWTATVPGQPNDTNTVEFFITAYDMAGNTNTSPRYNYTITPIILGDINGDGKVDLKDVYITHTRYGRTYP